MDDFPWAGVIAFVIVLALLCGIGAVIDDAACSAKTADIGMPHRWGIFSGCMVQIPDGNWLPLETYRYFGEAP